MTHRTSSSSSVARQQELQQTLAELYDDLYATDSDQSSSRSILRSLASLCAQFPIARRALGQLMQSKERGWKLLAQQFLYQGATARDTLVLLAALTSENPINQKRLIKHIAYLPFLHLDRQLIILTLPESVKLAFRAWKKRAKALVGHRVPTGRPPPHEGIPAPCFCNTCLGREQFMPTWHTHFNDLERWKQVKALETQENHKELSASAFLHQYLRSYRMEKSTTSPVVYYFAPSEEENQGTWDPGRHVSALSVEVDVINAVEISQEPTIPDADPLVFDRILLLETTRCIQKHQTMDSFDRMIQSIDKMPKRLLLPNQTIVQLVLSFLEEDEDVDLTLLRPLISRIQSHHTTPSVECHVQVSIVNQSDGSVIEIACREQASDRNYHTVVPELEPMETLVATMDDTKIHQLLQSCRLTDEPEATYDQTSWFLLKPCTNQDPEGPENPEKPTKGPEDLGNPPVVQVQVPIPGLCGEATQKLERLTLKWSHWHLPPSADHHAQQTAMHSFLRSTRKRLIQLIHLCDQRVQWLATSKDLVHVTTGHRNAAMERCRCCRDALVEIGKRMKLLKKPRDKSTIVNLLHAIHTTSMRFDAWETPDLRIEKLGLSRRLWASGVPDPEFYRQSHDRRQRNRQIQHQLNQIV